MNRLLFLLILLSGCTPYVDHGKVIRCKGSTRFEGKTWAALLMTKEPEIVVETQYGPYPQGRRVLGVYFEKDQARVERRFPQAFVGLETHRLISPRKLQDCK